MSSLQFRTISVLEFDEYTNNAGSISPNYWVLPDGKQIKLLTGETRTIEGFDFCVMHDYLDLVGMHKYIERKLPAKKETRISLKLSEFTKPEKFICGTLPFARPKRIRLIQPSYPYGKKQTYLGGTLVTVASQLEAIGYEVEILDMNINEFYSLELERGQFIGITILGAPYIPKVIVYAEVLKRQGHTVLIGGQGIEGFSNEQFKSLFGETAIQITNDNDLLSALGEKDNTLPHTYDVSLINVLSKIDKRLLKHYLSHEMTMVMSQGCHFKCAFCAARKSRVEQFKSIVCFGKDMRFLAQSAKDFEISELNFYATSLDFFQNPKTVFKYLELLRTIQQETGVKFKIRCLSCTPSFINAVHLIGVENFKHLMVSSGLWCVGLGIDGGDPTIWKAQKKNQNSISKNKDSLDLAREVGIRAEILMIMGFPQDNIKTLFKCVRDSIRYAWHWPNTMLRPYLAKEFVPGNDSWKSGGPIVNSFISDPKKFYNLDFCAVGSKTTHPRFWHRMWSNASYLTIIGILTPFGRCVTSPLLPQGNDGWYGKFAKWFNKIVPFDR